MELSKVKLYLRIEHDEDDEILTALIGAAEEYLKNAGVPDHPEGTETERNGNQAKKPSRLYELAVCRLVLHYYETREETGETGLVPFGIQTMIEQLRNRGETDGGLDLGY